MKSADIGISRANRYEDSMIQHRVVASTRERAETVYRREVVVRPKVLVDMGVSERGPSHGILSWLTVVVARIPSSSPLKSPMELLFGWLCMDG